VIADAAALSVLVAMIAGAGAAGSVLIFGRAATKIESDDPMAPFWQLGKLRPALEALLWLTIGICCLLPLLSLLATSIVPSYGVRLTLATVTSEKFVEVLMRQGVTVRAFQNSLIFAGTAAIVLGFLAIVFAYTLERSLGRLRGAFEAIVEIPYAMPGVVLGIACILLFLRPLPVIGISIYATPFIILFAYLARFMPLALKAPLAAMAVFSRDQEEAAALDGAGLWQRLRHIILPNLLPAATAGALLVFLVAFNELTVSALLWSAGTETLGVALLSLEEAGLAGEAAAVGVTATAVVALIMWGLDRFGGKLPAGVLPWAALAAVEIRRPAVKA
jgi:iron(III) transport system permease protein